MSKVEFEDVIARYGGEDLAVDSEAIPWIPYAEFEGSFFKPLRFDTRQNVVYEIGWTQGPGQIGRHQHHGPVVAFTLEGSWRYLEHDWVAKEGTLVVEAPGSIHTLQCDDPDGFKALFIDSGNIDYFGDDGTYAGTQNVWWWIDAYERHCAANGLQVDERLIV
jgi:hypothetical protein